MSQQSMDRMHEFRAETTLPFSYVCGSCGKSVSGEKAVTASYTFRKTAATEAALALTDQERREGQAQAEAALNRKLRAYRERQQKGDYSFLRDQRACPHCSTEQQWAFSAGKGMLQSAVGAALILVTVLLVIWVAVSGSFDSHDGTRLLILAAVCLFVGLLALIAGSGELKKRRELAAQAQQPPVVSFPEGAPAP